MNGVLIIALLGVFCPVAVHSVNNDGSSGLTAADRQSILDAHNTYRGAVSPTATDMKKMKWNFDLERMAQLWAETCSFEHGNPTCTNKPYSSSGQNLYASSGSSVDVAGAVGSWQSEVSAYTFSTRACSNVCGHYTQVVWANSEEVGCGIKKCTPLGSTNWASGIIVVCNYGPAGNYAGTSPYTSGSSCSSCGSGFSCTSNLCVNSTGDYTIAASAPTSSMVCAGDASTTTGASETTTASTQSGAGSVSMAPVVLLLSLLAGLLLTR